MSFKIGNLGDTLRLQCPIDGYPAPFFEWKKVRKKWNVKLHAYLADDIAFSDVHYFALPFHMFYIKRTMIRSLTSEGQRTV